MSIHARIGDSAIKWNAIQTAKTSIKPNVATGPIGIDDINRIQTRTQKAQMARTGTWTRMSMDGLADIATGRSIEFHQTPVGQIHVIDDNAIQQGQHR